MDRPRAASCAPTLADVPITNRSKRAQTSASEQYRIVGQHYQLGAEIGRGGFGTVYSALDLQNGRSVAIKQFRLHDIDKAELQGIESEINLLRKLNHENIVKYYTTIRSDDHLYIVLEYMENGSLSQFLKKFGALSETLVAVYISQVLRGLAYLHEQGVLHRDIKGANILTTKDGLVKLADFGVALQTNEAQKSMSVVGTPYWMAPEVIEMAGCSAASDIWSVGCTVVELLTGKPPYFDLAPMAALFRIVQDDYPPFPEDISPVLHDFILKCFRKEPGMRSSAMDLLKHPWIASIPRNKVEQSAQLVEESTASNDDRKTLLNTIKLYEQGSESPKQSMEKGLEIGTITLSLVPETGDEDWDAEFEVQTSPLTMALAPMSPQSAISSTPSTDSVVQAQLRAMQGCAGTENASPAGFKLTSEDAMELNDYFWDDDDSAKAPSPRRKSLTSIAKALSAAKSDDLSASIRIRNSVQDKLAAFQEDESDHSDDEFQDENYAIQKQMTNDESSYFANQLKKCLNQNFEFSNAGQLNEAFPEDDLFGDMDFEHSSSKDQHIKLRSKTLELLSLLKPTMDDSVILNACSELHTIFINNPAQRNQLMSQAGVIPNIMEALEVKQVDVLCAVLDIVNLIIETDKKFQENVALTGMIPVIVQLANNDNELGRKAKQLRFEAATFVRQCCITSTLTLQMFIACGGLPVLVNLLDLSVMQGKKSIQLIQIAIDGILKVFTLQTIPKNDFCRLFVKLNMLRKLVVVFEDRIVYVHGNDEEYRETMDGQLLKICDIFVLFSQGDVIVKENMSELVVLQGLLKALKLDNLSRRNASFYVTILLKLLKCVRNLSMEANTVDKLDRAGAIPALVHTLGSSHSSMKQKEIQNVILHTMFYLCRINRSRQTQAAKAGLVPFLQRVAVAQSPLKQFALPILCDLAHASAAARAQLWACNGVTFFLDLLADPYWQIDAMKAIVVWLINDTPKIESILLKPENLLKVIQIFRTSQQADFENLLDPLLEILSKCVSLNQALGLSSLFVAELVNRLQYPKAIVRKNLLKMLKSIFDASSDPMSLSIEHGLYPIVHELAQDESMIVVMEIANQLLQGLTAVASIESN